MQDRVRKITLTSELDMDDSNVIEHNIDLQRRLRDFIDANEGQIFIGQCGFTRRSVMIMFEALGDADPDAIVARHTDAHGADSDGGGTTPPDPSAASTNEPDASSDADPRHPSNGPGADDDPAPGADDDQRFRLINEEGETIADFDTNEEAWNAFENYDDAFDVIEPVEAPQ